MRGPETTPNLISTLLATKLHQPASQSKRVERPQLVERLNDGIEAGHPVILVSAPAGFGKTSCVSTWLDAIDRFLYVWVSLDPKDDDPGRFFTYFLAALQQIHPSVGREIEGILRAGQVPPAEIIGATIINDLQAVERRFLFVLDDLQVIQDELNVNVLKMLVENQPVALSLVLITREDPPLPLARLRARNQPTPFLVQFIDTRPDRVWIRQICQSPRNSL